MKLATYGRPATREEGAVFVEHYIYLWLELCKKMQEEKRILDGGGLSGAIGIAMIVDAKSALELDGLIENLPMWPRRDTTVTPLTTFDERILAISPRLERLKNRPAAAS